MKKTAGNQPENTQTFIILMLHRRTKIIQILNHMRLRQNYRI